MGFWSVFHLFAQKQHIKMQRAYPLPDDWKGSDKPLCALFDYLHKKGVISCTNDKMQDIYTLRAFIRLQIAQLQFEVALHPCDALQYDDKIEKLESALQLITNEIGNRKRSKPKKPTKSVQKQHTPRAKIVRGGLPSLGKRR